MVDCSSFVRSHPLWLFSDLCFKESFHLHSALVSLGLFQEQQAIQIETCLKDQLDIDSWPSFMELQGCDLEDVPEIGNSAEKLLHLIQTMKGGIFFSTPHLFQVLTRIVSSETWKIYDQGGSMLKMI